MSCTYPHQNITTNTVLGTFEDFTTLLHEEVLPRIITYQFMLEKQTNKYILPKNKFSV